MNKIRLAQAIRAKQIANGIHYEVLEVASDTEKEIEAAKQAVRSEYPLFDCRFFVICLPGSTNG